MTKKPIHKNRGDNTPPAYTFAEALATTVANRRLKGETRGRKPYKLIEAYNRLNRTGEWDLFVHLCRDKAVTTRDLTKALAAIGVKVSEMTTARWRKEMRIGNITATPLKEHN